MAVRHTTIYWVCIENCTARDCEEFPNCGGCENCKFTRHIEKARKYTIIGQEEIEEAC